MEYLRLSEAKVHMDNPISTTKGEKVRNRVSQIQIKTYRKVLLPLYKSCSEGNSALHAVHPGISPF